MPEDCYSAFVKGEAYLRGMTVGTNKVEGGQSEVEVRSDDKEQAYASEELLSRPEIHCFSRMSLTCIKDVDEYRRTNKKDCEPASVDDRTIRAKADLS